MLIFLLFAITAGQWRVSADPNGLPPNLVQQFLNNLCRQNNTVEGCKGKYGQQPSSSDTCDQTEKRCPQQPTRCFERNFNCSNLDLSVVCKVNPDSGISVQPLICGDGSRRGERCGTSWEIPVHTVFAAYCEGINDVDTPIGTSLGVVTQTDRKGGCGIYLCSEEGTWIPQNTSPTVEELSLSCRRAVCGSIPHPSRALQIQRRWPMIRAIKKNDVLHCSTAIVSKKAALTAAHCVTRSESSEQPDLPYKYTLEVPGPLGNSLIDVQLNRIVLHPHYKYNHGSPIFDLAVIFFTSSFKLPTLCLATKPIPFSHERSQVVFGLGEPKRSKNGQQENPQWDVFQGSKDTSCVSVSDRSGLCDDVLPVGKSQYCVKQEEKSIRKGSSGGPHLIEIGDGVKETWAIQGILSRFSNKSSCQQGRLIYIQIEEASTWLQNCVFNEQCS